MQKTQKKKKRFFPSKLKQFVQQASFSYKFIYWTQKIPQKKILKSYVIKKYI